MAFLGRKQRNSEVQALSAQNGRLRTKFASLQPRSSEGARLPEVDLVRCDAPKRAMNNDILFAGPYLEPIVTRTSQRPTVQVTAPGSSPALGPNPTSRVPPPRILTDSKSPRLVRSQSCEKRPAGHKQRLPERRNKEDDLAYLVVELKVEPSGPQQDLSSIQEQTSTETRERTMSVPNRLQPRNRSGSGASNSSGNDWRASNTSTSSSCSSHQDEVSPSRATSPKPKPPPRGRVLRSSSLLNTPPTREGKSQVQSSRNDEHSSPVAPSRRKKSMKSSPPSSKRPSSVQVSSLTSGQAPSSKPKPSRPPPPTAAALRRVKEQKAKSLSPNRSPHMSLPPQLNSHRSLTRCTENSAIRPDYEEIDQGGEEPPQLPSRSSPPKLPQRNALPLPPRNPPTVKTRAGRTISGPVEIIQAPDFTGRTLRSCSVPNVHVQPVVAEEPETEELDIGGGIYEPVNAPDDPPPVQPHLKKPMQKTDDKRGRSKSSSPRKFSAPATPKSDPLQRRRPPPPPLMASSLTVTESISRQQLEPSKAEPDKPCPIYEEIDQDQYKDSDDEHEVQSIGGTNVLPLPPKPALVSKVWRINKKRAAPELSNPVLPPPGGDVLAGDPKEAGQPAVSEEEPDIGGVEDYVEMSRQNGWLGESPLPPEGTTAIEDEGGETYVEMHPVTSVCHENVSRLVIGSEGGAPEEEDEGEDIYIEMNPNEYLPSRPSLHYASRDIVGMRPDLQADF